MGGAALDLLPRVHRRALNETHALAALGRFDINAPARRLAQERLQLLPILDLHGEQDGLWPAAAMGGVILPHKVGDGLAVLLQRLLHHLHILAGEIAVHKVQHRKAGLRPPAEADGVRIRKGGGDHALLMLKRLDRPQAIPQRGSPLKAKLLRRLLHLSAKLLDQLPALAVEDQHGLHHAGAVVLRGAVAQAPARAASHVVVEAGALFADVAREPARAVRQQQRFGEGVDDVARLAAPAEGAEIARPVLSGAACDAHSRVFLL